MTTLFTTIEKQILSQGLGIASQDLERPWGGFFVIDEKDAQLFADIYFDGYDIDSLRKAGKLSPKILLVKPAARLSWQYHHRRAETWRVIQGPVGVVRSFNDTQNQPVVCEQDKMITLTLFVIVNNDHQRALKQSKEFQLEDERMLIVSSLRVVDKAILSIDTDRTVCKTIEKIAKEYGQEYDLAFANGGDQNNDTIPEKPICQQMGITLLDGLGDKIQSSSWLLKK